MEKSHLVLKLQRPDSHSFLETYLGKVTSTCPHHVELTRKWYQPLAFPKTTHMYTNLCQENPRGSLETSLLCSEIPCSLSTLRRPLLGIIILSTREHMSLEASKMLLCSRARLSQGARQAQQYFHYSSVDFQAGHIPASGLCHSCSPAREALPKRYSPPSHLLQVLAQIPPSG